MSFRDMSETRMLFHLIGQAEDELGIKFHFSRVEVSSELGSKAGRGALSSNTSLRTKLLVR